jgi:hypothetical protein
MPALAFFWSSGPLRADEYKRLAGGLSRTLKTRGLSRLAISDFLAQGTGSEEARYAQQRLSEALFNEPGIGVMDLSVLEKLKDRGRHWPEVLIQGEVYPSDKGVAVIVKALDARDGRVLGVMQIAAKNMKEDALGDDDFRDAISAMVDPVCIKLLKEIQDGNRADVDLKARYWAAKVREPDFSYSQLDRFPGGEFADYQTRQKFYELINVYYEQPGPVLLTKPELARLKTLEDKEARARAECRPE